MYNNSQDLLSELSYSYLALKLSRLEHVYFWQELFSGHFLMLLQIRLEDFVKDRRG